MPSLIKALFKPNWVPKAVIIFLFPICIICGIYLDQINEYALELANSNYSNIVRHCIVAFVAAVLFGSHIAERYIDKDPRGLFDTVVKLFSVTPPLLGAYQLTIWLLLDANSENKIYMPMADNIDFSVFVFAIILLFNYSADNLVKEINNIRLFMFKPDTVKVTVGQIKATERRDTMAAVGQVISK